MSEAGASRVAQPPAYLYVTPHPLSFDGHSGAITEPVPGHARVKACPLVPQKPGRDTRSAWPCSRSPSAGPRSTGSRCQPKQHDATANPGYDVGWVIPVLIAAIDPAAEAKLDGLDRAVISGRYLAENAADKTAGRPAPPSRCWPRPSSGMDEYALTRLQRLTPPKAPAGDERGAG